MPAPSAGVSVVIPVFNGRALVGDAISSVSGQSYRDREIIVVDDGSTDGTAEFVRRFEPPVSLVRKTNGGVASALNAGIRAARGRWVAWLSHDDLFLPGKLERQVAALEAHPDWAGCYTDYRTADGEGRTTGHLRTPWYPRTEAIRRLFVCGYIGGSTTLVRKECYEAIGYFREDLRYTQDTNMWLRLLSRWDLGRVAEELAVERHHTEQGSTVNREALALEAQRMYLEFFEAGVSLFTGHQSPSSRDLARAYIWFGDSMRMRGFDHFSRQLYRTSVCLDPSLANPARRRLASALVRGGLRAVGGRIVGAPVRHWS